MKTKLLLCAVLVLAFLTLHATSPENQERDVPSFFAISLRVPGTLILSQGGPQHLQVKANENVLEELITEVKDGTLIIRFQSNNFFRRSFYPGNVHIEVTVPEIHALSVSGSGNVDSDGIEARNLEFTVSGSGNIKMLNLTADRLKATVSGSGNIHIETGTAGEFTSAVSGSGRIKADEFEAADADVRISGSGKCSLTAQRTLKARVSGSGGIYYRGNPQLDTSITGSGKIKKL